MADKKIKGYRFSPTTLRSGKGKNFLWLEFELSWFIEKVHKIYIDRELMQRVFAPWKSSRIDNYFASLLDGTGLFSIRILVEVNSIIMDIEDRLSEFSTEDDEYENLNYTLTYMKDLKKDGKEYILLDGQHRIKTEKSWMAPEKGEVAYKPTNKKLNEKFTTLTGESVKLTGKEFVKYPSEVQELIREIKVPVVVIQSASVEQLMSIYKAVNSGSPLTKMDLRLATFSMVADFLRDMSNIEKNPFTVKYFKRAFKSDFLKKRDDLRTILLSVLFAYPDVYKQFDDKTLDSACEYGAPIKANTLKKVTKAWDVLAEGFLTHYRVKDTFAVVKLGGIKNLSLLMHTFTYQLLEGKLPIFSTELKGATLDIGRKDAYVDLLEKMIIALDAADKYYYYDDNHQITVVEHKNDDGTPRYVTNIDPITKEETVHENEHGFCRQKIGRNVGKNINSQLGKMNNYFYDVYEEWLRAGVLVKKSKKRSLTEAEKLHKASKANWVDQYTGDTLMTYDVTDGDKTHAVHVGDKSYSEGGEEMEVGNANINKKIGTKKVNIGV